MTTAMQIFINEDFGDVRIVIRDGEPWFVAADVCRALELSNPTVALERLDDDEKAKLNLGLPGGDTNVVSEEGLYTLVLSSRKPEAKKFKRWITHEVIPSIRKTGSYSIKPAPAPTPVSNAIHDIRLAAEEIQLLISGIKPAIAQSQAIDIVTAATGFKLDALKQLLPPAEHETGYLNATQIGKLLGGIPPQAVNKLLAGFGLQYKVGHDWRLTDDGKAYGEEMPYTRNGHTGYQIRWNENVVEALKQAC